MRALGSECRKPPCKQCYAGFGSDCRNPLCKTVLRGLVGVSVRGDILASRGILIFETLGNPVYVPGKNSATWALGSACAENNLLIQCDVDLGGEW